MQGFLDLFLHLDAALGQAIASYGPLVYALLFAVVFVETGVVIMPFLPGDSLLFAAGTFAGAGRLNVGLVAGLLFVAAVLGDTLNYWIGRRLGSSVEKRGAFLGIPVSQAYLEKTKGFYQRHGSKTVVIARFMPIIRTFAPFVAGVGQMHYATFAFYNIAGAALWVGLFVGGGYFFGGIPVVRDNFTLVILAIVALSLAPAVLEFLRLRRSGSRPASGLNR